MSPQPHEFRSDSGRLAPGGYDTAQICLQGHCVNSSAVDYPRFNEDYCSRCGQPTIMACRECRAPIRGYLRGSIVEEGFVVPTVCHACGAAYPWTQTRLATARGAIGTLEGLTPEERQAAAELLEDLVHAGPKTGQAAGRFRKALGKAGSEAAGQLMVLVMEIASEPAKKALL